MAGRNAREHQYAVETIFPGVGRVRTTQDILSILA